MSIENHISQLEYELAEQKRMIYEIGDAFKRLDDSCYTARVAYTQLSTKYMELDKRCNLLNVLVILGWGVFVATLITAVALRGGVL